MIGSAIVYVINRWAVLPAIDPMMRLVPEAWFFVSHLLFGLVVGAGITMIASREGLLTAEAVSRGVENEITRQGPPGDEDVPQHVPTMSANSRRSLPAYATSPHRSDACA
ncbi:MAG: hypothetical protein ACRDLT_14645 [Solirubrobacteraceae bacterium]